MRARQSRYLVLAVALASTGCKHSFTREDALTAIAEQETLHRLLEPATERVAHETVADCRAIYDTIPAVAEAAGDSAWILLSSAGWMDLADVDAPSDPRQKKHCRAIPTSKADQSAFHEAPDASGTPWTSYWTVETARTRADVIGIPEDLQRNDSAVAYFELTQERTPIGEILHRPKWTDESARLLSTTLTGHFRHADDGWHLESFDAKK